MYTENGPSELRDCPGRLTPQVGALLVLAAPENRQRLVYLAGVDRVRYLRVVRAGDAPVIEVRVTRRRGNAGRVAGIVRVDGAISTS